MKGLAVLGVSILAVAGLAACDAGTDFDRAKKCTTSFIDAKGGGGGGGRGGGGGAKGGGSSSSSKSGGSAPRPVPILPFTGGSDDRNCQQTKR